MRKLKLLIIGSNFGKYHLNASIKSKKFNKIFISSPNILKKKINRSIILDAKNITNQTISNIEKIDCLIIDNYNSDIDEKLFYSILNQIKQLDRYIVVNSDMPIKNMKFKLKVYNFNQKGGSSLATDNDQLAEAIKRSLESQDQQKEEEEFQKTSYLDLAKSKKDLKYLIKARDIVKTSIENVKEKGIELEYDDEILNELSSDRKLEFVLNKMKEYKFSNDLCKEVINNWNNLRKDLEVEGVLFD